MTKYYTFRDKNGIIQTWQFDNVNILNHTYFHATSIMMGSKGESYDGHFDIKTNELFDSKEESISYFMKNDYLANAQKKASDLAIVAAAFAGGQKIESTRDLLSSEESQIWYDCPNPKWDLTGELYRIKVIPKPKYIPLEYGDIMAGDLIKYGQLDNPTIKMVLEYRMTGVQGMTLNLTYEQLFNDSNYLYSKNKGVTWKECRKLVKNNKKNE